MTYDEAVTSLYQAPFAEFVAERKRLSAELKAAGDKDDAARVAKLSRPPVSAWAVNQLWWQERDAFEALIRVAARVKAGDREASRLHREALTGLRDHATRILQTGGNAATDTTLRRVTTTLSALAASGGFDPDPPGALVADRDPPGFEALGFATMPATAPKTAPPRETEAEQRAATARQRAAEAERRRAEDEERNRRLAERERLSAALHEARALQTSQQRELSRLRADVEAAEQSLRKTQALLAELEAQLASL